MSDQNRRAFLKQTAGIVGTASLLPTAALTAAGANGRISLALIGAGGRGTHVAEVFRKTGNVEISWICDPDESRRTKAAATFGVDSQHVVADLRKALEDRQVDAVLVATPDHWHAPASILACDAGKHVYVEKPCSHNVREGRLLVEAARRNKCLVQHGTQCRSTAMMAGAVAKLREGVIGDVLGTKVWNVQRRNSIGKQTPSEAPAGLDYDTWVGPAPLVPYQANKIHGGWHWWYEFGTGDMGNDGVHDIDYARWGLGVETHPSFISAVGGKFFFDDDQQFPDTQQVTFEYPGDGQPGHRRFLVYEQRLWSTNYPYNVDSGVEFYGTKGQMFLSRRGKVQATTDRNQKIELGVTQGAQDEQSHVGNFLSAIRSGTPLNAEIEIGHLSSALCHLGNLATRLGRSLRFDPATERIIGDPDADRLVSREYRASHWGTPKGA
jgi:predicted dehydrogenase